MNNQLGKNVLSSVWWPIDSSLYRSVGSSVKQAAKQRVEVIK
jgi:hypothetical protein